VTITRYSDYRPSGINGLEDVPSHWTIRRLKHICEVLPSNVDKKTDHSEMPVRLCNYTDVYYNEAITASLAFMQASATPEQVARFTLRAGDTIITKDSETADDIAIAAYVPDDLPGVVCGYHLAMVRPHHEHVHGQFIKRFFDSRYARMACEVRANGLTRVGLSQYEIDNVDVPVPPLDEQRAIAAFLDRETAKIDALVAEQEHLLALLSEKHVALSAHLVSKGLVSPVSFKESGSPWIGSMPAHWKVVTLGQISLSRCDGPFGSGLKSEHYRETGVRVVRLQNIRATDFSDSDAVFIDADYCRKELQGHDVISGDILVAGLGDDNNLVGRACVAPPEIEPAIVKADCFRFRLDHTKAIPAFVAASLSAGAAVDGGTLATGSTRSRINLSTMETRRIALPPLEEQATIAQAIESARHDANKLIGLAERSIQLLAERRAALITAAVTGQIDVRDAAKAVS
jgi:type I restriction enzyme S subunit